KKDGWTEGQATNPQQAISTLGESMVKPPILSRPSLHWGNPWSSHQSTAGHLYTGGIHGQATNPQQAISILRESMVKPPIL
ncbi:hypothetical protein HispidOSU_029755, partial [Sigmodon hispidus]